jgi:glutamate racemase
VIGVIDSGVGGITALYELTRLYPKADLLYLADRKNAPYGTKDEDTLTRLLSDGIKRLSDAGADHILIACCTASTVYHRLPPWQKAISTPIIKPAAVTAVSKTKALDIGVIATERTVSSHAFEREIKDIDPRIRVRELPLQPLVGMVESGVRDGGADKIQKEKIKNLILPSIGEKTDVLILGCTHFTHLSETIGEILGDSIQLVSPSLEGARAVVSPRSQGCGFIRYL